MTGHVTVRVTVTCTGKSPPRQNRLQTDFANTRATKWMMVIGNKIRTILHPIRETIGTGSSSLYLFHGGGPSPGGGSGYSLGLRSVPRPRGNKHTLRLVSFVASLADWAMNPRPGQ